MAPTPLVAIVTLNWNGWPDTIELLASLSKTSYENVLVVIVDNASTNDSVVQIQQWLAENRVSFSLHDAGSAPSNRRFPARHFALVQSKCNLGFCGGNNLGLAWGATAGADYLLVLNNDTLVAPDFIEPLVEAANNVEGVGLLGGVITYCEAMDTVWFAGGTFNRFLESKRLLNGRPVAEVKREEPYETAWISGCMMMIPSDVYGRYGGYEEAYFIWAEEWDYSLKLSEAGFRHVVVPSSRICHKVGRSLGVMQPLNYYYGIRNGMLFKRNYLPSILWHLYLLYYLPNRVLRYAQLLLQGRSDLVRAGVDAVLDGLRGQAGKWRLQKE